MIANLKLLNPFAFKRLNCRSVSTPTNSRGGPVANLYKQGTTSPPFSQSPAYFGQDRSYDPSLLIPVYIPSYYDSQREERDVDELWESDQRLIIVNSRKQSTLDHIKTFKQMGKDTRELELQMIELTAKEAEIRAIIQKEKQIRKDKEERMLEKKKENKKEVKEENDQQKENSQKRWFLFW
uniref:39S ribosomal protein L52, mitochondrial n=1 Tax=Meloidogyne hapla TaxID=6305 RepID=A0A1I8AY56_MELHA